MLRPSHVAVCESLLTSRQTLLFVGRHDSGDAAAGPGDTEAERRCGSASRPWTIATERHGQRINVSVVDLARHPHADDDADDSISASDDRCRRFASFTEPEVVSVSRDRCDEDGRRNLPALGEAPLYSSQTGRVGMVLASRTTASDKFLLIFTGS